MLGCGDDRDALFDDTGLLMCDLLQIFTEVFLVVHRYIRDDGNDRDDDIRRVVEPAHTDLHDSVVDLLFSEIPERHSRQEFKFRRSFDAVSDGFSAASRTTVAAFAKSSFEISWPAIWMRSV